MTRFIFLSLGFAAPTLAMVLVAGFNWHQGPKSGGEPWRSGSG